MDADLSVVRIVIRQPGSGISIGVVKHDLVIVATLLFPDDAVPRSIVGVSGLFRVLVDDGTRVRIDPEHVLAQVVEVINTRLIVGPDDTDVVDAVARIEADLGPGSAETVGAEGSVTRSPLHVVIDEAYDVAKRIVFDVERERITLVGVRREVSSIHPVDLNEGITARGRAGFQAYLSAGRAGLPIGPGIHVGPEGSHDWCRLRETTGGVLPQRPLEGDIAVVVDVEISVVVAVELERETQGQDARRQVVIRYHHQSTRRHEIHVGGIDRRNLRQEFAQRFRSPDRQRFIVSAEVERAVRRQVIVITHGERVVIIDQGRAVLG